MRMERRVDTVVFEWPAHPALYSVLGTSLVHVCVLQYYNPYNATSGLRAFMKTVVCCREAQHELSFGRAAEWVACDAMCSREHGRHKHDA